MRYYEATWKARLIAAVLLATVMGAIMLIAPVARSQTAVPATAPSGQYGGLIQPQAFSLVFPDATDGHAHVARPADPFPIVCVSGCSGGGGGGSNVSVGATGATSTPGYATLFGGGDSATPSTFLGAVINHGDLGLEVHVMNPTTGVVTVSNFPATQPVSGSVSVGNFPATQPISGSVSVANFPATQPVSGAVTANLGMLNGAATAANQAASVNGSALESGGNLAGAKADLDALAGAISGATPQGLNFTGYVDLQNGGNSLTITASGAAKVDGSGVTQPVSGSVAVSNMANYTAGFAGNAISISTAGTTQLITASGSTLTYITHLDIEAGGAGNFTLEYGTGTLCGTGTVALTGPYALTAQSGLALGNGAAPVLKPVPASNNVCAVTSAAVQMSGSILASQQ